MKSEESEGREYGGLFSQFNQSLLQNEHWQRSAVRGETRYSQSRHSVHMQTALARKRPPPIGKTCHVHKAY